MNDHRRHQLSAAYRRRREEPIMPTEETAREMQTIEKHTPATRPGPLPGAETLRQLEATFDYLGEIATAAACMRGILRREMTLLRTGVRPEYTQVILDRNQDYINLIRHRATLL